MINTISERLRKFLKYRGIDEGKFALLLKLSKQQVSLWFTNVNGIPTKHLSITLEQFKNLNARWLLTGVGEMLNTVGYKNEEENHDPDNADPKQNYYCNNPACKSQIDALNKALDAKEEVLELLRGKRGNEVANSA